MDRRGRGFRGFRNRSRSESALRSIQGRGIGRGGWRNYHGRSQGRRASQSQGRGRGSQQERYELVEQYIQAYPGYEKYYYTSEPLVRDFEEKIRSVQGFLSRCGFIAEQLTSDLDSEQMVNYQIEVTKITEDAVLRMTWRSFMGELKEQAEDVLALWNLAAHMKITEEMSRRAAMDGSKKCPRYYFGFVVSGSPPTPVPELKAPLLGRYVTVTGIIIKSNSIQPYYESMCFKCLLCGRVFPVKLRESHFVTPEKCPDPDCDNKKATLFDMIETSPKTTVMDSRRVLLRDLECMGVNAKAVDCVLLGRHASEGMVGDMVTLHGVLKMYVDSEKNAEISLRDMYIEVAAIHRHDQEERHLASKAYIFSDEDRNEIRGVRRRGDLLKLFVHSLAPAVYGNLLVKAGLLLGLFGGSEPKQGVTSTRSQIHILMCGSPGISKSTLLKRVVEISPHSGYACMTSTSACGISVSMTKDSGGYSVDSGLLVNYSGSIVCLDEIDKAAGSQHGVLLEAMESQSVTISKCGLCKTFPAKVTIIAAGNPANGAYDRSKSVIQNLKISKPLYTRFDLVYILGDEHNKEFDMMLVEHRKVHTDVGAEINFIQRQNQGQPIDNFAESLALRPDEQMELLTSKQMQIYIAYARKYIHPELSMEAKQVLKDYFLELRSHLNAEGDAPVSIRILESLIRMSQAMARVELCAIVTAEHARKVVEISKASKPCMEGGQDDYDIDDLNRTSSIPIPRMRGINSEAKQLISALNNVARKTAKSLFSLDEIKGISAALKLTRPTSSLIEVLNHEGFLIKRLNNTFKIVTVD